MTIGNIGYAINKTEITILFIYKPWHKLIITTLNVFLANGTYTEKSMPQGLTLPIYTTLAVPHLYRIFSNNNNIYSNNTVYYSR